MHLRNRPEFGWKHGSQIINTVKFENKLQDLSPSDREFVKRMLNYIRENDIIQFGDLPPEERKRYEAQIVKEYQECKNKGDKECMKKKIELLYFGNFLFILNRAYTIYRKRRLDYVTLEDLLVSVIPAIVRSADRYKIDNPYNARFLAFAEKYIEKALLSTAMDSKSAFTITFTDLFSGIEDNDNTDEIINDFISDYDNDTIREKISVYDIEREYCDCAHEIIDFLEGNINTERNYIDCLIGGILNREIMECIINNLLNQRGRL